MATDKIDNLLSRVDSEVLFNEMAALHFDITECAKQNRLKKGLFVKNGLFICFNNETGFFYAAEFKNELLAKLWLRNSVIK